MLTANQGLGREQRGQRSLGTRNVRSLLSFLKLLRARLVRGVSVVPEPKTIQLAQVSTQTSGTQAQLVMLDTSEIIRRWPVHVSWQPEVGRTSKHATREISGWGQNPTQHAAQHAANMLLLTESGQGAISLEARGRPTTLDAKLAVLVLFHTSALNQATRQDGTTSFVPRDVSSKKKAS